MDIQIISATHRNLEEMIASRRFREDLWFRLNVFPIMIPPLRQRKEDIPALVHHFIEHKSKELKLGEKPALARGAIDKLIAYDWPGNVRELQNLIERALIQHRGGVLSFEGLLPPPSSGGREAVQNPTGNRPLLSLEELNARHISQALERAGGKINGPGGAAEILGIHPEHSPEADEQAGDSVRKEKLAALFEKIGIRNGGEIYVRILQFILLIARKGKPITMRR